MNTDINQLLNTCLEIEGLLCLACRRQEALPDYITNLLLSKTEALHKAAMQISANSTPSCNDDKIELTLPELPKVETNNEQEHVEQQEIACSAETEEKEDAEPDIKTEPIEAPETNKTINDESATVITRNDTAPLELTVNDKFRFRRELFSNSDVDLAEALQIAAQMSSAEEAEDYFYNDLCFDPENDTVKDFMRVVAKHFS